MKIYNTLGYRILDIQVDDNSYQNKAIMGDHSLTLYYSLPEHVEIPVGSYCEFAGVTYTLERPENFKMKHSRLFEYTVVLDPPEAKAKIWKFRNPIDGRLKFPLTAKPIEHLQMFVDNMNRRDKGWSVGDCIDGVETLINYDHAYCLDALKQQADTFKTEYEFKGKRVSLKKVEYNKSFPLPLSYGRGKGFKSGVGRSNTTDQPPVEVLYVQGGEKNIDPSKYGSSELLLPRSKTLYFDGEHFEDEGGFNKENARMYATDADGRSIRRYDKQLSSLAEDSMDCSEIYPKHVGSISSVVVVDEKNHFYDIIDSSIPPSLNFENCLIEGETMTIVFQSGMLAGREFDVKYFHEEKTVKGVKKAARRFEIVPQDIDGQTMPNATFAPRGGDKYAVFNCMLPDSYVCDNETKSGASWDMFRAAVKYLFDNEEQKFTFSGELDGIWAKKDWLNISGRLVLGGFILFSDERFQKEGIRVRIVGIKTYINKPHSPVIELSNSTVTGGVSSTLKELQSQDVTIQENHKEAVQFTKRRFRDAKETITMLEESLLDNFTGSINPIAVQTMSMLVGDESLQFRFVTSRTAPQTVAHSIVWDNTDKQLKADAGIIQHMTIGISSISPEHKVSEYRFWDMERYSSGRIEDEKKRFYLYAKVSKTAQTGVFLLSEKAIKLEQVSGFYHLLVGVLNSEYNGERSFAALYGFSEILPGRVTTDRVVSGDGQSFFDMVANTMKLGNRLSYNVDGDGLLKIRGTIVQSEGGSESYLGCFRGNYTASYTYYPGDEVVYKINGLTSTYRYIYSTPSQGIPPSESAHWQVIAAGSKGEKGQDGTSVSIKGQFINHYNKKSEFDFMSSEHGIHLVDYNEDSDKYHCYFIYGRPFVGASAGWMCKESAIGDSYIQRDTGNLYVAIDTGWENVGKIKGEQGEKGEQGQDGADAPFYELRYASNGSTSTPPPLNRESLNPSGWTTSQPSVPQGHYLWMTTAKKAPNGSYLIEKWSQAVRITPYDGTDGKNGESPAMVYRGNYQNGKEYYGNKKRLDCVKSGDTYYIARIDAGTFSNIAPPNTNKWNNFGASFESVATNLLLTEHANIGDWHMSGGKIVSTLGSGDIIALDAKNNVIKIQSAISGGDYSIEQNLGSTILMNAKTGVVEARSKDESSVSYLSPSGILANRAGTRCGPPSDARDQRAAVCAMGFGNLDKAPGQMTNDYNLVAGVYGLALNRGTAPSYGGYFVGLKAKGFFLEVKYITSSGVYLTDEMSLVVGLTSTVANVYLPASSREGQMIIFKQWGTGTMRIYPRSGQKIHDDISENEYYDCSSGQTLTAHFVRGVVNGVDSQVWLVGRYKW